MSKQIRKANFKTTVPQVVPPMWSIMTERDMFVRLTHADTCSRPDPGSKIAAVIRGREEVYTRVADRLWEITVQH